MKKLSHIYNEAIPGLDGRYGDYRIVHKFAPQEGKDLREQIRKDLSDFISEYFPLAYSGLVDDKIEELAEEIEYEMTKEEK